VECIGKLIKKGFAKDSTQQHYPARRAGPVLYLFSFGQPLQILFEALAMIFQPPIKY
jgi:hypothetical protein